MASRHAPNLTVTQAEALKQMDLDKIMRAYVQTAISSMTGYKALLLDKETMRACSTLFGRSELADSGVVHIERLDAPETLQPHPELKALLYVRPTRENINLLKRELRAHRFQHLSVFFTNLLSPIYLQELAEADAAKEYIKEVQEFYGDFSVQDSQQFTVQCPRNEVFLSATTSLSASSSALEYELIDRCVQGISAVFLAVRRRPVIRYQSGSGPVQKLAESLYSLMYKQQYQVFDFGSRSSPVLLILDRNDDPVTPLLMQWTYQAMIHELLGIHDNTAKLTSPKVVEDQREVVLDARSDEFFRKHAMLNFGEVGMSVKALMEQYQRTESEHRKVESLDDMRRFMSEHLDFTRLQGNVTKHINIMSELSDTVKTRSLLDISEMEQELASPATNVSAATSLDDLMRITRLPNVLDKDKVRLAMLYALRFEDDPLRIRQLQDYLTSAGIKDREPRLCSALDAVLRTAGQSRRAGDLFASRSIMGKARSMFKGLQGVDNVYTQHTPLLTATLTSLSTDKLEAHAYPFMAASQEEGYGYAATFKRSPPREVVVFIVGGTTHEEAKAVAEWNDRNPHMRVILGGTGVLNSSSFLSGLVGEEQS